MYCLKMLDREALLPRLAASILEERLDSVEHSIFSIPDKNNLDPVTA
jgi:hypothetical protein